MGVSRRDFLKLSGTTAMLGSLGVNLDAAKAYAKELRIKNAKQTTTICPYCSVGCGLIVHAENRVRVSSHAVKCYIAKIQHAGEAHHDIQPKPEADIDEDVYRDVHAIAVRKRRQGQRRGQDECRRVAAG